jgi:hypothetical protein
METSSHFLKIEGLLHTASPVSLIKSADYQVIIANHFWLLLHEQIG